VPDPPNTIPAKFYLELNQATQPPSVMTGVETLPTTTATTNPSDPIQFKPSNPKEVPTQPLRGQLVPDPTATKQLPPRSNTNPQIHGELIASN
jgi:hypothetical protein